MFGIARSFLSQRALYVDVNFAEDKISINNEAYDAYSSTI